MPLNKKDGYSPVIIQDPELKESHESEEKNMNAGGAERDAEQSKTSNTVEEEKLSTSQLVTRRGFTLLFSVLMLAVGVVCHFAFPVPEPSLQSRANFTLSWANYSTPSPLNSSTTFWATFNLGLVTPCGLRLVLTPLFQEASGFMLLFAKCLGAALQSKWKQMALKLAGRTKVLQHRLGLTHPVWGALVGQQGPLPILLLKHAFFLEERTFYYKTNDFLMFDLCSALSCSCLLSLYCFCLYLNMKINVNICNTCVRFTCIHVNKQLCSCIPTDILLSWWWICCKKPLVFQ